MSGAITLLPHMPSWRGAQLKHRDKFTFIFTICYHNSFLSNEKIKTQANTPVNVLGS
jgi:hypothetical protein